MITNSNRYSRNVRRAVAALCLLPFLLSVFTSSATAAEVPQAKPRDMAEIAAKLEAGIAQLRREIPSLSPAEKEWLAKETDASLPEGKITARYLALTERREFLISAVTADLDVLSNLLRGLREHKPVGRGAALVWTHIAQRLSSYSLWNKLWQLSVLGIVDKASLKFVGLTENFEWLLGGVTLVVQEILENGVIPYLNVAPEP